VKPVHFLFFGRRECGMLFLRGFSIADSFFPRVGGVGTPFSYFPEMFFLLFLPVPSFGTISPF